MSEQEVPLTWETFSQGLWKDNVVREVLGSGTLFGFAIMP